MEDNARAMALFNSVLDLSREVKIILDTDKMIENRILATSRAVEHLLSLVRPDFCPSPCATSPLINLALERESSEFHFEVSLDGLPNVCEKGRIVEARVIVKVRLFNSINST